jgi:hypothetical protein
MNVASSCYAPCFFCFFFRFFLTNNDILLTFYIFIRLGVLKIDPRTDHVSLLYLENGNPLPIGQWKWHGGLRANHKIYGFPNNADCILVIDCQINRVYTISGHTDITNPSWIQSGRHRIPQDGRYKYLGGATNHIYVYLFPCDAEQVLRIHCATDTLSWIGPFLLDGENKFQNGFYNEMDQCIYGIPQRATGILRIIPKHIRQQRRRQQQRQHQQHQQQQLCEFHQDENDDDYDDHVDIIDCGSNMTGMKDKFEGGVLGPDGCIYCIPLRSSVCIKVVPSTK